MASAEAEAMRQAIMDVYQQYSPEDTSSRGFITDFIVIAEVVGDDGEPWLKRISGDGPMWRTVGMLTTIMDDLRAELRHANQSQPEGD